MTTPAAANAVAVAASVSPARRLRRLAASASIDAACAMSVPAPSSSTAGLGRQAVTSAWAHCLAPSTRATARNRVSDRTPPDSSAARPGVHRSPRP